MGRPLLAALLAVACTATLISCGGGGSDSPKPAAEPTKAATVAASDAKPTTASSPAGGGAATSTSAPSTVPATVAATATTAATTAPTLAPTAAPTVAAATATTAPPPAGAASARVTLADTFEYIPASVTIRVGGTVTWTWQGGQLHDVTSTSFPSDPAGAKQTGTYQFTFTTAGSYSYVCTVDGMQGVVIVQ